MKQIKNQSYKTCGVVYITILNTLIKMFSCKIHKMFVQYVLYVAVVINHTSVYQLTSRGGKKCKLFVVIFFILILFVTFSQNYCTFFSRTRVIQPGSILKLPLNKSEKLIFKSRLGVMSILVRKIAVAQVYQGLTERKLWPGIRVKNQPCALI